MSSKKDIDKDNGQNENGPSDQEEDLGQLFDADMEEGAHDAKKAKKRVRLMKKKKGAKKGVKVMEDDVFGRLKHDVLYGVQA